MKFKIFDKNTNETVGPFDMSMIKAYDGEVHSIWIDNGKESVVLGNDLGYGKNDNTEIQKDLIFMNFTGILDKNKKEIYENDFVEFVYDPLYNMMGRGVVTLIEGTYYIMTKTDEFPLYSCYSLELSNYRFW